jgi:hypothetical protein
MACHCAAEQALNTATAQDRDVPSVESLGEQYWVIGLLTEETNDWLAHLETDWLTDWLNR